MTNIIRLQNQTIRDVVLNHRLELFEVKQLAEMEASFKDQCKVALRSYKKWCAQYQHETDVIELFYGQLTGIILRRQAENAVQAYWIIRHDFRSAFARYLDNHKPYQTTLQKQKSA